MNSTVSARERFYGVQALRGFSAILVMVFHTVKMVREKLAGPSIEVAAGAGGVDIFFAISGFVMIIATAHAWGHPDLWLDFLRRRILRIVPLYWLMTAAMIALLLAMPQLAHHTVLRPWHSVASFLFIPAWNAHHEAFPVLVVGWTLSFEMLFYAVFTAVLALRLHPARWVSMILFLLVILSLFRTDAWGAPATLISPLLLEFVFSMWIGMATLKGYRLPVPVAWWLAPLAVAAMFASDLLPQEEYFKYRLLVWGVPGALLLASVVALEDRLLPYVKGWPKMLGDASYAIYLTHGFVITLVALVVPHLHLGHDASVALGYAGSIALGLALGVAIHRTVELSLIGFLRNLTYRSWRFSLSSKAAV